jgi:hypothetical protein
MRYCVLPPASGSGTLHACLVFGVNKLVFGVNKLPDKLAVGMNKLFFTTSVSIASVSQQTSILCSAAITPATGVSILPYRIGQGRVGKNVETNNEKCSGSIAHDDDGFWSVNDNSDDEVLSECRRAECR